MKLKTTNNKITYIVGLFIKDYIKKGINAKDYYFNLLKDYFIKFKDMNICFFGDQNTIEYAKTIVKTNNIRYYQINLNELPTYNISKDYYESRMMQDDNKLTNELINNRTKMDKIRMKLRNNINILKKIGSNGGTEKGVSKSTDEEIFRFTFTIWTSKLYMIEKTINDNPFNSIYFAWTDASCTRWSRPFYLYSKIFKRNRINHFPTRVKYFGKEINLNAGYMMSDSNTFTKLIELFKKELEQSKNDKYGHDEETLIQKIFLNGNQKLFHKIINIV